jgi:uncharacterized protein (DUF488 family)
MSNLIFTVGHSTHPIDHFLSLLTNNGVTAVADVRSSPFSRYNPHFNRDELKKALASSGVSYVFLGAELGARSDDPDCYVNGKVQYHRLAESRSFQFGVARVLQGSKDHRIALMCAEKEPLDCHRTILVARELVERGADVRHILADGSVEAHAQSMVRLLDKFGLLEGQLFRTPEETEELAYAKQAEKIAYDKTAGASVRGSDAEGESDEEIDEP